MSRVLGPKVDSNGKLSCIGCSEWRLHHYYGNICRLGLYPPDYSEVPPDKICPYYKTEERNKKFDDLGIYDRGLF